MFFFKIFLIYISLKKIYVPLSVKVQNLERIAKNCLQIFDGKKTFEKFFYNSVTEIVQIVY